MRIKLRLIAIALNCLTFSTFSQQKKYIPADEPLVAARIEEWQNLKFGLLFCAMGHPNQEFQ